MTIVGPDPDEEIARKGPREEILAQEQEFIADYKRQGFEFEKMSWALARAIRAEPSTLAAKSEKCPRNF